MYKYFYSFESCFKKIVFKAFSLAEVLFTLTIVGIIASLVLPVVIADTQKAETAVKVKKYQLMIAQASLHIKNKYGEIYNSPINTVNTDHANGWNTFKTELNLIRDCGATTGQNCWGLGTYKFLNGNNWVDFNNYTTSGKGILLDGSLINYESSYYCIGDKSANSAGVLHDTECAIIFIDTNGPKPPNQGGRDVFSWHVLRNGSVLPYGSLEDRYGGCDPNSTDVTGGSDGSPGRGGGCTMQVLRDGKITY